jgi:hypothetical protein
MKQGKQKMYNLGMLLVLELSGTITFLLAWKYGGKIGLYCLLPILLIVANIQVLMQIQILGIVISTGGLFGLSALTSDVLNEHYGEKVAKQTVWIGFAGLVAFTIFSQILLWFRPASIDWAFPHLKSIFGLIPRIALGSLTAYVIGQWLDTRLFSYIKSKTGQKHLWFRNNASTMISGTVDSFIFITIAFYGIFTMPVLIATFGTNFIRKNLETILDTPTIYLTTKIKPKEL